MEAVEGAERKLLQIPTKCKADIKYRNMNVIFSPIVVTMSNNILPHLAMCQFLGRSFICIFLRIIALISAILMQGTHSVTESIYLHVKMQTKNMSIDITYPSVISPETDIAKSTLWNTFYHKIIVYNIYVLLQKNVISKSFVVTECRCNCMYIKNKNLVL